MSKERVLLLAKLQAFVNAAVELEHAFGQLESEDDQLTVARDYPFDKAFEELLHDIFAWRDSVQAKTETYRCPKCGTPHSSTEFEDEGEGDEAGRTFRYCSEACKESH